MRGSLPDRVVTHPLVTSGAGEDFPGCRALMSVLIDEARLRAIEQLSLSVEVENYVKSSYTDLGFTVVDEVDGAATMVLNLG
jgi:hypothetical protein